MAWLVAAAAGLLVAPLAFRLKGLYLAFVTLGLVFIGDHIFREYKSMTGGQGVGRSAAPAEIFGWELGKDGNVLGVFLEKEQKFYFFGLLLLLVMGLLAKNMVRSRIGRALGAIRDRDIAAEISGVPLARYKVIAFVVSSFYAGIAGAVLWMFIGFIEPSEFNLLLSIEYIAMVLIGGVATISGSIMGATFITFLPRMVDWASGFLPFISDSLTEGVLTSPQVEEMLFGALIIVFLIVEPLGLYGLWIRIRNYFKAWPFSY